MKALFETALAWIGGIGKVLCLPVLFLIALLVAIWPQPVSIDRDAPSVWEHWSQGLPSFAQVQALSASAEDPAVLLAATYDPPGVWRSMDYGRTWEKEDTADHDHPVFAILWDPGHQRWWAGTEAGLLYRSAESGAWQAVSRLTGPIYDLALDSNGYVYAVLGEHGVFRYEESTGWTCLHSMPQALAIGVSCDGKDLFLGTEGDGVWVSHDCGKTWAQSPALPGAFVWALTVDPGNSGLVYAHTKQRVYRSFDGGQSWESFPALDRRTYASIMPHNGAWLTGLKGRVARSLDRGQTWQFSGEGLHPDAEVLDLAAVERSSGDRLSFAATSRGIYRSRDQGITWERMNNGPGHKTVTALGMDRQGRPLAATPMGLYRYSALTELWEPIAQEFSLFHFTSVSDAAASHTMYVSSQSGLLSSADNGQTWHEIPSELASQSISEVLVDPENPDRLFVNLSFERVYESSDAGGQWTARWEGMGPELVVQTAAIAPEGDLWAGTQDGLYNWDAGSGKWQQQDTPFSGDSVFALAFDSKTRRQYVGTTTGAWYHQAGEDWQPCSPAEMGQTVTSLALTPDGHLYAGTERDGLWHSCDAGDTWARVRAIPAVASVNEILHPAGENTVFVATGCGVFVGKETICPARDARFFPGLRSAWRGLVSTLRPLAITVDRLSVTRPRPAAHTLRPDDQILQMAATLGFRGIVQVLSWEEMEPTPGEWHWEFSDQLLRAVDFYGFDLVVRLDHPPEWARQGPSGSGRYPFDLDRYLLFVNEVARRYGDAIRGYIVWNEPNLAEEWGASPDPQAYAGLLQQAYGIIKRAAPSSVVVSAGLAPTNAQSKEAMDDRAFLEGLYRAGGGPFFDALGAHPYGFAYPPDDPYGSHDGLNMNRLLDLRHVMEMYEARPKPVWITELGWTTDGRGEYRWLTVDPEEQKDYLVDAWIMAGEEMPWVELFTVWNLGLVHPGREAGHAGYSILRADGLAKPAGSALGKTFSQRGAIQQLLRSLADWLRLARPDPAAVSILSRDEVVHLGDSY